MDKHTLKGPPSTHWTYHDALAGEVTLKSDDKGVIHVRTRAQARAAEDLGLGTVTFETTELELPEPPTPEGTE